MSVASALEAGRARHLSRMVDEFEIGVPTGGYVYDPEAGTEVEEISPLFTTPGYFAARTRAVASAEAGGRTIDREVSELRIPWDADEVPSSAVAVCTAIGPTTPPRQLGRRVRVNGSSGDGSQRTHYPLEVVEVLS